MAPELISTGAKAIVDNAERLGLTWQIQLATVLNGVNPTAVSATYDGDTEPIDMTSMIGGLSPGQRVYVIKVPPSGNFIVGFAGGGGFYRARQTLIATAASVTFSIPAGLRSLRLKWKTRSDAVANLIFMLVQFNSDASANYYYNYTQGINVTASAATASTQVSGVIGFSLGSSAAAGVFGTGMTDFPSCDLPGFPSWNFISGGIGSGAANIANATGVGILAVSYPSLTSLKILSGSGSFIAGSDFQLTGEYA
jgi:hypothetical protein